MYGSEYIKWAGTVAKNNCIRNRTRGGATGYRHDAAQQSSAVFTLSKCCPVTTTLTAGGMQGDIGG